MVASAAEVVSFWQKAGPDRWFKKDPAFDDEIRERFLTTYEAAAAGQLSGWERSAEGALALLILLDQFPRNMPGLVAGLALLWIFLFVPFLSPLKSTMASIWLAYSIVWLAYGMRLVSGTLLQVAPELEEAARTAGASDLRVKRDVTVPLIKYGMAAIAAIYVVTFHPWRRVSAREVQHHEGRHWRRAALTSK